MYASNPLKSAFGLYIDEQKQCLHNMTILLKNIWWRSKSQSEKYPVHCILGFLTAIKSTIAIWEQLKLRGYSYLLTAKLNTDACENMFSQIRFCLDILFKLNII